LAGYNHQPELGLILDLVLEPELGLEPEPEPEFLGKKKLVKNKTGTGF
jgi:hypothetical protein